MELKKIDILLKKTVALLKKIVKNKKFLIILGIIIGVILLSIYPSYLIARGIFNRYFNKWGDKLVSLEKRGLLSKEFGAAWQDILDQHEMEREAGGFISMDTLASDSVLIIDGIAVRDYPSLSIVARLNEVHAYSNTINITGRKGRKIAVIRTDHTRAKIE
jgi:hypothetical protein